MLLLYTRLITAQSNLVFNGGFDTNAAGWRTNQWGGNSAIWEPGGDPGGCLYILLSTEQYVSGLVSGSNYLVSWSSSGGGSSQLAVGFGNVSMYTVDASTNQGWEYFGFVFAAESSVVDLFFAASSQIPFEASYFIDNVSMQSFPETPVPSLWMFPTPNWVALSISGPPGRSVVLESSTNLVFWRAIATNALPCFCPGIPKTPVNTFYRASMPSE
jgi:hypothetical protein